MVTLDKIETPQSKPVEADRTNLPEDATILYATQDNSYFFSKFRKMANGDVRFSAISVANLGSISAFGCFG